MSTKAKTKAIYALDAEPRHTFGTGAGRRLRRLEDKVPGILYGGGEPSQPIMLDHKKMMHALANEGFYSHLLTLNVGQDKQQVILKALHRHPFKKAILHVDFLRVKATDQLQMRIPIHFLHEADAPGVEAGGIFTHHMTDIEIKCQASLLPEFIEVEVGHMQLDDLIHISDLKLPKGAQSVALMHGKEADQAVISLHLPRAVEEEVEAPAAVETAEGAEGAPAAAGGAAPKAGAAPAKAGSAPPKAGGAGAQAGADKKGAPEKKDKGKGK